MGTHQKKKKSLSAAPASCGSLAGDGSACCPLDVLGNYYGTPKPPSEPSPVQPDLVDQVLFDEEFDNELQRKRTPSVSKMERKDSAAPEEEEDEERTPPINGLTGPVNL